MADDLTTSRSTMSALTGAHATESIARMSDMRRSATAFGRAMSDAFAQGILGSRNFDDVLKTLYLRHLRHRAAAGLQAGRECADRRLSGFVRH